VCARVKEVTRQPKKRVPRGTRPGGCWGRLGRGTQETKVKEGSTQCKTETLHGEKGYNNRGPKRSLEGGRKSRPCGTKFFDEQKKDGVSCWGGLLSGAIKLGVFGFERKGGVDSRSWRPSKGRQRKVDKSS